MTTTLEHVDALRDVFADLTQDCLLVDLTPRMVQVEHNASGSFAASVQFTGSDVRAVNTLAESWGLAPGRIIGTGTYIRDGQLELNGRTVQVQVYSGHPGGPIVPASYAPQAVETEADPEPDAGCSCGARGDLDFILEHVCPLEEEA